MLSCLVVILSSKQSVKIDYFCEKLKKENLSYVNICDFCTLNLDQELLTLGFTNLTRSPYIKKPSAWDKAFYFVSNNDLTKLYDYFFFIEEDVYSTDYTNIIKFILDSNDFYSHDLLTKLIRPQSHYPTWKHWKEEYVKEFKFPSQSFNPICRISKTLLLNILDYQKKHSKFNFHEIIFPSLCLENNLSYLNYIENKTLNKYIGKIQYNPIITEDMIPDTLIYHPVKDSTDEREKSKSRLTLADNRL